MTQPSPDRPAPTPVEGSPDADGAKRPDLNLAAPPKMVGRRGAKAPRVKRSRKGWLALFAVAGLGGAVAAVALAPMAISSGPGQKYARQLAQQVSPGAIDFEHIQVGWLSPTRIEGLRYRDTGVGVDLSVDSAVTSRSLGDLLLSRDLGVVEASGVELDLTLPRAPRADGPPPTWPAGVSGTLALRDVSVRLPGPTDEAPNVVVSARTFDLDARDPHNLTLAAAGDVLQGKRRGAFELAVQARGLVAQDGRITPFSALFEADVSLRDVPTQLVEAAAGSDVGLAAWIGPSLSLNLNVSGPLQQVATQVSFEAERAGGAVVLLRDGATVRLDDAQKSGLWVYATPASERAARGGDAGASVLQHPVTLRLAVTDLSIPATTEQGVDWRGASLAATLRPDGPLGVRVGDQVLSLEPFEVEVTSSKAADQVHARLRTRAAVQEAVEGSADGVSSVSSVVAGLTVREPFSESPVASLAIADAPIALVDRLLRQNGKLVAALGESGELALDVSPQASLAPEADLALAYQVDWQSPRAGAVLNGRAVRDAAGWTVDVRTDPGRTARWQPPDGLLAGLAGLPADSRWSPWLSGVDWIDVRLDPSVVALSPQAAADGESTWAVDMARSQGMGVVVVRPGASLTERTELASVTVRFDASRVAERATADAALSFRGGWDPALVSVSVEGLLGDDGALALETAPVVATGQGAVASPLIAELAGKPWLSAVLGPVARIETLRAERGGDGAWTATLAAESERAAVDVAATGASFEQLRIAGGSKIEVDPSAEALAHVLEPLNPLLRGVVQPTRRASIVVDEQGLSLDDFASTGLASLTGDLALDLGGFRFDRQSPLGALAGLLADFGVEKAQSITLPAYRLELADGRAQLAGAAIGSGDWTLPLEGGWDLATGELKLVVSVPAQALAKAAPPRAAGLLPADLVLRVPLRGDAEGASIDGSAFRAEVHKLWTSTLRNRLLDAAGLSAPTLSDVNPSLLNPPGIAGDSGQADAE